MINQKNTVKVTKTQKNTSLMRIKVRKKKMRVNDQKVTMKNIEKVNQVQVHKSLIRKINNLVKTVIIVKKSLLLQAHILRKEKRITKKQRTTTKITLRVMRN